MKTFSLFYRISRSALSGLLAVLFLSSQAAGYITVAPTAISLSDAKRSGEIIVRNNSTVIIEISVDFRYGYPVSDSSGNIGLSFVSVVDANEPNAAPWVHAYPKKFILYPKQTRTIRFVIRPPEVLPEGEYWARPVVTAREQRASTSESITVSDISARINTAVEAVLALSYRKGKPSTNVFLSNLNMERRDAELVLLADLHREGNAAYVGNAVLRLYDEKNVLVRQKEYQIAVYYSLRIGLKVDIHDLPQGTYRAELEVNTRRNDVEYCLQASPVHKTVSLALL